MNCGAKLAAAGLCASNNGTSLTVGGKQTQPGVREQTHTEQDGGPGPGAPAPPVESAFESCLDDWDEFLRCFSPRNEQESEEATDDPAAGRPLTLSDLARFAPDGTVLLGEPGNAGVVGLPVNFIADAEVHTRSGDLFGRPVTVRFTPAWYDFHFGDRTESSTRDGGADWAALGQAAFTPTATSHAYEARGTYFADVDVRYTAEIDLGAGWFPVPGELTAQGPAQEIRVFEAHTALVARTCTQTPSAPGC